MARKTHPMLKAATELNDRAASKLKEVERIKGAIDELRITDPNSPRLEALSRQFEHLLSDIEKDLERSKEAALETQQTIEKIEDLIFDIQKQIITLSATFIVALLAFSAVFEGSTELLDTVGGASSSLIYAVVASITAMVLSGISRLRSEDLVGRIVVWIELAATAVSFGFFFRGLLIMARFLSSG